MKMSLSFSQGHWYAGNLNKNNEVSINISVKGLDDPIWEKKVTQITLLFLEGYKLKINPERISPSVEIKKGVIEPGDKPTRTKKKENPG
jgi:hypothetical protein